MLLAYFQKEHLILIDDALSCNSQNILRGKIRETENAAAKLRIYKEKKFGDTFNWKILDVVKFDLKESMVILTKKNHSLINSQYFQLKIKTIKSEEKSMPFVEENFYIKVQQLHTGSKCAVEVIIIMLYICFIQCMLFLVCY